MSMTIKKKMTLNSWIVSLFFMVIILTAWIYVYRVTGRLEAIHEHNTRMTQLMDLSAELGLLPPILSQMEIENSPALNGKLQTTILDINQRLESMQNLDFYQKSKITWKSVFANLSQAGKSSTLKPKEVMSINLQLQEIQLAARQIVENISVKSSESITNIHTGNNTFLMVLILLGIIIIGGLTVYSRKLTHHISDPIVRLKDFSHKIAAGKLNFELPASDRNDEISQLINSYGTMVRKLSHQLKQLKITTNVLSSSVSEIVSSATQISASTTETAASVTESVSTVEEVKQTSNVIKDKAELVAKTASETVAISEEGKQSVTNSINAIQEINGQVQELTDNIVLLSEHSQSISNIINFVKDIAEQSNLLAVNASIEAAKAGDAGRGFNVVAREIRSLAEQSKKSTEEISAILNDIQKDTSKAVMAAEQAVKSVKRGVNLANESGEAIESLSEAIIQAADAMEQITIISKEQFLGVDQLTQATGNIKEATEQNVDGVKQIELAMSDLKSLSEEIQSMIDTYEV